jgi:hypothetical protein
VRTRILGRLLVVVATAALAVACDDGDEGTDGTGGVDGAPKGATRGSEVTIADPTGDTELYNDDDRPSAVTRNVDVENVAMGYGRRGLAVEVTYAEPIDRAPGPAEIFVHLSAKGKFDDRVLKWRDRGRAPEVIGEDGVATSCRLRQAEVDRADGRVRLVVPPSDHCLGASPEVEVGVTAYNGSTWDRVEDATLLLP